MLFRLALLLSRPILMTGFQRCTQTLTLRVYTPLKVIFNSRITCDIAMKLWLSQQNFLRITCRSKPHPFVASLLRMRQWLILKRGQTLHTNYLAFKTTSQFLRSRNMWPWNFPKCLLGKRNWLMRGGDLAFCQLWLALSVASRIMIYYASVLELLSIRFLTL